MRYRREIDNVRAHIHALRGVVALLCLIIGFRWHGWNQSLRHLRVHLPPGLPSGAVVQAGETPPSVVYSFAQYIFQQLNRCTTTKTSSASGAGDGLAQPST